MKNLKQGDIFYCIDGFEIISYTYFSIHPSGNGRYHILIRETQQPVRVYVTDLEELIETSYNSYNEACLALSKKHKGRAKYYNDLYKETL